MHDITNGIAVRLIEAGYYIGKRDPNRNWRHHGKWMICENTMVGRTADASTDGYCVVGDDLRDLLRGAAEDLFEPLDEDEDETETEYKCAACSKPLHNYADDWTHCTRCGCGTAERVRPSARA